MDITAAIIFHHERALALPALASFSEMVETARASGLSVETCAILDRPDDKTAALVRLQADWFTQVNQVDFGDLGLSRNSVVASASGRFLAFFDGDDLWSAAWLLEAFRSASIQPRECVLHPDALYYFSEEDFPVDGPVAAARSFFMFHTGTDSPDFDPRALLANNLWTANVFTTREIHARFPYLKVERETGFGIEDWSWNLATVAAGIPHLVVPGTLHLIRQKHTGSLRHQNDAEGLLPSMPADLSRIFAVPQPRPGVRTDPKRSSAT